MNKMLGLAQFLQQWNEPCAVGVPMVPLTRGKVGSINASGEFQAPAVIFTRFHPQFIESVEPGVRPMVLAMISDGNWASYSSCEGHVDDNGRLLSHRSVGLVLCRPDPDRFRIAAINNAAKAANTRFGDVQIDVKEVELETEAGPVECVDVNIVTSSTGAGAYPLRADAIMCSFIDIYQREFCQKSLKNV